MAWSTPVESIVGVRRVLLDPRVHVGTDLQISPTQLANPVAFLVTIGSRTSTHVILLREGVNEVGRGCPEFAGVRASLGGVIEGWQWVITCKGNEATVQDRRSTDGSVLLRGQLLDSPLYELRMAGLGVRIGWDGKEENSATVHLREGDILVNQYGKFVFAWVHEEESR